MIDRKQSAGWLALLGGGEFSFEETEQADAAWLAKCLPGGDLGFLPTASGSVDYGNHFAVYLDEYFERKIETVPVFRGRDARRGKNAERLAALSALYVGGGLADQLLDTLSNTPCLEAMTKIPEAGGVVAAIAAGAQAFGEVTRPLTGRAWLDGFAWLPGTAIETNFDPGHDRRLRQLIGHPRVDRALAIAADSVVLLGPDGAIEVVGDAWLLDAPDGKLNFLG